VIDLHQLAEVARKATAVESLRVSLEREVRAAQDAHAKKAVRE
jgi:hypothetical protein